MSHSSTFEHYVGIDVSKNTLDIAVLPDRRHWQIPNTQEAIKALAKSLPRASGVILESTGGYERLCAQTLHDTGQSVCVVNPTLVFHFRKSHNQAAKTDAIDAMILAHYGKERPSLRYGLASRAQQALADQQHCLSQLKTMKEQARDRASKAPSESIKAIHQAVVARLEEQIKSLDAHMLAAIEADEALSSKYWRLQTAPGVGHSVAMTLVASLPELGALPKKAIGRLVGVAPVANDSGLKSGKRFIQGGRADVRRAIYMASLVGMRHNPTLKAFYQKKVSEGKPKMVALVACMNKLTHILNSMLATETDFGKPKSND